MEEYKTCKTCCYLKDKEQPGKLLCGITMPRVEVKPNGYCADWSSYDKLYDTNYLMSTIEKAEDEKKRSGFIWQVFKFLGIG